jgi:RsiW-degrading membrane proteinase PrsW (M82 family)
LFFPRIGSRPISEVLADILINPVFMAFELACVAVFGAGIFDYAGANYGPSLGPQLALLAGAGALLVPLGYMALAWIGNVHGRSPLRFVLAAFVWGALSAVLAFVVNAIVAGELGFRLHTDVAATASLAFIGTIMIAPMVEELAKALGVLVLSWHHRFRSVSDGLLYGFAVGAGFSFVENWIYFVERANPFELGFGGWVDFVIYRVLFNSLAHGAFPAACGALIGYFKSRPNLARYASAAFLPGLFIAITLHTLFNISAILDEVAVYAVRVPVFIFNPAMVAVLVVALLFVFYFGSRNDNDKH